MNREFLFALPLLLAAASPLAAHAQSGEEAYDGDNRGGFFAGAQVGQARVFNNVDQDSLSFNAGYRWRAGSIALVGVEGGVGRLDGARDRRLDLDVGEFKYRHVGAIARISFGHDSRWYGIARSGYFDGDIEAGADESNADGAYFGVGIGADLTHNLNLNLVYTTYAFPNWHHYWDERDYSIEFEDIELLSFGVEYRF